MDTIAVIVLVAVVGWVVWSRKNKKSGSATTNNTPTQEELDDAERGDGP